MQLSKTQITDILSEVAHQEDGLTAVLQMAFEALMKSERSEHNKTECDRAMATGLPASLDRAAALSFGFPAAGRGLSTR